MHPIVKIIIGAILVIGAVYYVLQDPLNTNALRDLKIVINGVIPPLVFIVGLFIVWLELDELRIEKEIKSEERRPRRKR